jgi:hypothetical protein
MTKKRARFEGHAFLSFRRKKMAGGSAEADQEKKMKKLGVPDQGTLPLYVTEMSFPWRDDVVSVKSDSVFPEYSVILRILK